MMSISLKSRCHRTIFRVMRLAVYTLNKKPRSQDTDSRSGRCVVEAKISADHIPLDCRKGIEIER